MKGRAFAVAVATATLLPAGCAASGGDKTTTRNQLEQNKRLGQKRAGIYAVPVPAVAEPDSGLTTSGREAYRFSPSVPRDALIGFYQEKMPVNRPFGKLDWCGVGRVPGAQAVERVWKVPGAQNFLVLQILEDQRGPLVNIIDDRNNPGRTCQQGP